jgi:hypothetical protein
MHHAERRVRPCDDDVVGFDKALCEADRAACLDHVRLDGEPLSDLGSADVINGQTDCHHLRRA